MNPPTEHVRIDIAQRRELLALARQSIETGLRERCWTSLPTPPTGGVLSEPGATFVTLRKAGELRGCCGSLEARQSLASDVWRNAWASAFSDPRFPPLVGPEYPDIDVHISALSPLEPLPPMSEAELLRALRPGVDCLVLRRAPSQATFLPSVWEQVPDASDFLRHLKRKAGWSPQFWADDIQVLRYTVEDFGEHDSH